MVHRGRYSGKQQGHYTRNKFIHLVLVEKKITSWGSGLGVRSFTVSFWMLTIFSLICDIIHMFVTKIVSTTNLIARLFHNIIQACGSLISFNSVNRACYNSSCLIIQKSLHWQPSFFPLQVKVVIVSGFSHAVLAILIRLREINKSSWNSSLLECWSD